MIWHHINNVTKQLENDLLKIVGRRMIEFAEERLRKTIIICLVLLLSLVLSSVSGITPKVQETDIHPAIIIRTNNLLSNISSSLRESVYEELNEEWCSHLQSNSEPQIVVYPRMPKCGSSTMNSLFQYLTIKNKFEFVGTPRETWTSLDLDRNARRDTLSLIKGSHTTAKRRRALVAGHFEQTVIDESELNEKGKKRITVEMIQLIRDCEHKASSLFYYTLFRQRDAVNAEKKGKLSEFIAKELGINSIEEIKRFNISSCLETESCVKKFGFSDDDHYRDGIRFLCGAACLKSSEDAVRGALYNVLHPHRFAVVGILDDLASFLDMLECAYPKMLKGILQRYRETDLHQNVLSTSHTTSSAVVSKIIEETCNPNTSDYAAVYKSIEVFLDSRYRFMKLNRGRCCRK